MSNPKIIKGQSKGYLSFILHLAPASSSGYEVCPGRSRGCTDACLNISGHGAIPAPVMISGEKFLNRVQAARVRKTRRYFQDRKGFLEDLRSDIRKAVKHAEKTGYTPVVRLNGTSDLRWEVIGIPQEFPDVQFYDYTKISNRKGVPSNYHLTFSLSESNGARAKAAAAGGLNIAVVFSTRKGDPLPREFMGMPVVNGDESDLRFLDPKGVVVGLYAKGRAKNDISGFVQKG